MSYQAERAPSAAITWVRENRALLERARDSAAVAGKALPDAVLEDPTRLVDVVRTALVESVRSGAPAGVAEALVPVLRFVSLGAEGFDRDGDVGRALSSLQGLRDPDEISNALAERSLDGLDPLATSSIERMRLLAVRRPSSDELFTLGPDDVSPSTSPFVVDSGGPSEPDTTTPDTTTPDTTTPDTTEPEVSVDPGAVAAELGAVIGTYLGGAPGAALGAQFGAQFAGGGSVSPADLGYQIGHALGGPDGATIGSQIGSHLGGGGDIISTLHTWIDAAACALCGPLCLPCVLAADALTDVVVQLVQEAIH